MMRYGLTRRTGVATIAALGLSAAGVAYAAIPAGDGTISGCYATTNGLLGLGHTKGDTRIVEAGESCRSYEKRIAWSQRGPKGDTGAQGARGEKGETGATGEQGETGATGEQGERGLQGEQGGPGQQGERGLQGAQGPAGVSGYEIKSEQFPDGREGGRVLCEAGRRVLGGGVEILDDTGIWQVRASNPFGSTGWEADLQLNKDIRADRGNDEFFGVSAITIWAICASAS